MILKGPVLIPQIPDYAGDVLSEEDVRKAALDIGRYGILIDVQHKLQRIGSLIEHYITDNPILFNQTEYPKGTLFVSVEVHDE